MKLFPILAVLAVLLSVVRLDAQQTAADEYALQIRVDGLYDHVDAFTHPRFEGRRTGTKGGLLAAEYIENELKLIGLYPPVRGGYMQPFTMNGVSGINVMGILGGTDLKDEVVVLMAHYDHIGSSKDGIIYPGAEDNASGVAALLEIAKAFANAKHKGYAPRRTLLFIFFDGNKHDLAGSTYYINHPVYPAHKTVLAINMDMVGRSDGYAENFNDYVFVLGSDKISSDPRRVVDSVNNASINMTVDYNFYNSETVYKLFYPMSDHYVFEQKLIPALYFTSGITGDIHSVGDVMDKLHYPTFMRRTRLVFQAAWYYAMNSAWPQFDLLKKRANSSRKR
ncbi:MAG: M28 family peptidase [Prevotellaceae bacterium]|jgi:hypothetical protein|nr:M28 family peptidase [Prevotellaceae bacterium]